MHCNYNDHSSSDLTIQNVIAEAENKGLESLAITEHVAKASDWVPNYLEEIDTVKAHSRHNLEIIPGFEAKILQDGSIDCLDRYAYEYFMIASFHTTYADKHVWFKALERTIENPSVDVIGHLAPESSFSLDRREVEGLANLIVSNKESRRTKCKISAAI